VDFISGGNLAVAFHSFLKAINRLETAQRLWAMEFLKFSTKSTVLLLNTILLRENFMEISTSKNDLLKELTLTQGVVERKTRFLFFPTYFLRWMSQPSASVQRIWTWGFVAVAPPK